MCRIKIYVCKFYPKNVLEIYTTIYLVSYILHVQFYPYFWFVANDFVHCALSIKCSTFAFSKEKKHSYICTEAHTHTHIDIVMDFSICLIKNVGLSIRLVEAIHLTWLSGVFKAGHFLCWTLRHSTEKKEKSWKKRIL